MILRHLVVFRHLPNAPGGASTVIRNLFSESDDNVVIAGRSFNGGIEFTPNYQTLGLPLGITGQPLVVKIRNFIKSVKLCGQVIREKKLQFILGVYRDESSLVLSYMVSLYSRKNLFIYLTDLYAENYRSLFKRLVQKLIFKRAKVIFCLNQAMADYYISQGYKNVEIIKSTIEVEEYPVLRKYTNGVFRILFSGTVLHDRLRPLQSLVKIIRDKPEYELVFLTSNTEEELKNWRLWAGNVSCKFISKPELLLDELKSAHLLYLPLTFESPISDRSYLQLKTCLGTKSYEYMLSGVPILVHSPKEYFTYQFFEEYDSAIVLDTDEEGELEKLIENIRLHYNQFTYHAENAYNQLKDHDASLNRNKMYESIKSSI